MYKVPSPIPASGGNHQPCAGPSVADPVLSHSVVDGSAPWGLCSVKVVGERFSPVALGMQGMMGAYYVIFWQDRFLVTVTGPDGTPDTQAALMVFSRAVETRIKQRR